MQRLVSEALGRTMGDTTRKEPVMNALVPVCLGALLATLSLSGHAESLRCDGNIIAEGDSRLSVLAKCGQPVLADSYCAPVYYYGSLEPIPAPLAGLVLPCQRVDVWLYDRGVGNLMAMVRFHAGIVQAITYGRVPR